MSKRLKRVVQLDDAASTGRAVKIYLNTELNEYVCQLFIQGGHYEPADYFTDSWQDALGTAEAMCKASTNTN